MLKQILIFNEVCYKSIQYNIYDISVKIINLEHYKITHQKYFAESNNYLNNFKRAFSNASITDFFVNLI